MSRRVRPTKPEDIRGLTDSQLAAYVVDTKYRVGAASNASIRKSYRQQLEIAEAALTERSASRAADEA